MYKYLPIATDLKEMMVMLKSLPAYTLVFDNENNLVDLNESTLHLLKINSIQEFNERTSEIFLKLDYIRTIICELRKGNTVRHVETLIKCADDSQIIVGLCACMISGCPNLFLFQLFELPLFLNSNLVSFVANFDIRSPDVVECRQINSILNSKIPITLHIEDEPERELSANLVESESMKPLMKHRKLSKIETTISKFLALNMTVSEIAYETNKSKSTIHNIIYRIAEKRKLNFTEDVGSEL